MSRRTQLKTVFKRRSTDEYNFSRAFLRPLSPLYGICIHLRFVSILWNSWFADNENQTAWSAVIKWTALKWAKLCERVASHGGCVQRSAAIVGDVVVVAVAVAHSTVCMYVAVRYESVRSAFLRLESWTLWQLCLLSSYNVSRSLSLRRRWSIYYREEGTGRHQEEPGERDVREINLMYNKRFS